MGRICINPPHLENAGGHWLEMHSGPSAYHTQVLDPGETQDRHSLSLPLPPAWEDCAPGETQGLILFILAEPPNLRVMGSTA